MQQLIKNAGGCGLPIVDVEGCYISRLSPDLLLFRVGLVTPLTTEPDTHLCIQGTSDICFDF